MDKITEKMLYEAQLAMPYAYAPYSNFKVAACIYTDKGNLYTGVNVENISYGLTLCAEAAAIGNMISAGEQTIKKILILAGNKELCTPCGACRQRLFEFSKQDTSVYLCKEDVITTTLTLDELLPLAFDFKFQEDPL